MESGIQHGGISFPPNYVKGIFKHQEAFHLLYYIYYLENCQCFPHLPLDQPIRQTSQLQIGHFLCIHGRERLQVGTCTLSSFNKYIFFFFSSPQSLNKQTTWVLNWATFITFARQNFLSCTKEVLKFCRSWFPSLSHFQCYWKKFWLLKLLFRVQDSLMLHVNNKFFTLLMKILLCWRIYTC